MMHVWTVPHPEGVFAHDAPSPEYRGGTPVADPGSRPTPIQKNNSWAGTHSLSTRFRTGDLEIC